MFTDVLSQVTAVLDRRFVLRSFLPSLAFSGLLVAVWVATQSGLGSWAGAWDRQQGTLKVVEITAFIAWVTLFAGLLSGFSNSLLRLYEGYWTFPLGPRLADLGCRPYRIRLETLAQPNVVSPGSDPSAAEKLFNEYPLYTQPEEVMPTRLGNILKNAERYPADRYDLESTLMLWPRLYKLLPDHVRDSLDAARDNVDFMVAVSALSAVFSLLAGIYVLIVDGPIWLFLLCFAGGFCLAWLTYQGAVAAALPYGAQMKSVFDLYRNELLKQLRLLLPENYDEERGRWHQVSAFLYTGAIEQIDTWVYVDSVTPSAGVPRPIAPELLDPTTEEPPAEPSAVGSEELAVSPAKPWKRVLLSQWAALVLVLLSAAGGLFLAVRPAHTVMVAVARHALPAYYRIDAARDLTMVIRSASSVSRAAVGRLPSADGHYTLAAVAAGMPITPAQLGPTIRSALARNTAPVGIPSHGPAALPGTVHAGDTVDILLMPAHARAPIAFRRLFVLDVRETKNAGSGTASTIVVAFPRSRLPEFAARSPGASFMVIRAVSP